MNQSTTVSMLAPSLLNFKAKNSHTDIDVREAIALVDFHLRIVYTLVIAFSRRPQMMPIKLASVPGFGTMLASVRQGSRLSDDEGTPWIRTLVRLWSADVVDAIDRFKVPSRYKSFKSLRDRLSHGHPLPSDLANLQETSKATEQLVSSLQAAFERHLSETSLDARDGKLRMSKKGERAEFEIFPLWSSSIDGTDIKIYSHFTDDAVHYIGSDGDIWSENTLDSVAKFRKVFFHERPNIGVELGRLVKDVLIDIAAYTEDYSRPSYFFGEEDNTGHLFVPWTRSMSDGNESRIDSFRIGPNSRKEWREKNGNWIAYSDFLKQVSNWEILARRIGLGLDTFSTSREAEESSRLGAASASEIRGPSSLKEMREGRTSGDNAESFELTARIDDACQRMKPSTSVFFLVGQAGLGKTELMLSLAVNRAKNIAANAALDIPLYLFVSSTGRTLSSLEDAVNSALNITKLLSSHSAKALCRNGLLVLLVDGFDELLGSSGYENALGSLEPWFRELGGRGVLVASARSSYYLTQYRRSLALAGDLNVDHTLVELQPWSRSESQQYLFQMGTPNAIINQLKDRDWSILSIPFFAKAFAAWIKRKSEAKNAIPSMFEIVIEQYLDRESQKLKDPNLGELLNSEELRELFSEVAELMQGSKNREIEQSDLVYCAQIVVGTSSLDADRPGLTRRLSSLCGLGVTSDSSGQHQFGFSHEVLFDCFLSLAIQRRMSAVFNEKSILGLLSASKVNAAVFEWVIEKDETASEALSQKVLFDLSTDTSQVLSANLGTLWEVMLNKRHGVPPTRQARGLTIETIRLSSDGWVAVDFTGSTISHLVVLDGSAGEITIAKADISLLDVKSENKARRSLKGVESANITSVLIGSQFADRPVQVREILVGLGLSQSVKQELDDELHAAARYYLDRLRRRTDIPVIIDREDKSAEDQRLSWISNYDGYLWESFVNALVTSGVARLEPLATSGRPKVRLSFNTPAGAILEDGREEEGVVKFWGSL